MATIIIIVLVEVLYFNTLKKLNSKESPNVSSICIKFPSYSPRDNNDKNILNSYDLNLEENIDIAFKISKLYII